jgi:hypothetical protein
MNRPTDNDTVATYRPLSARNGSGISTNPPIIPRTRSRAEYQRQYRARKARSRQISQVPRPPDESQASNLPEPNPSVREIASPNLNLSPPTLREAEETLRYNAYQTAQRRRRQLQNADGISETAVSNHPRTFSVRDSSAESAAIPLKPFLESLKLIAADRTRSIRAQLNRDDNHHRTLLQGAWWLKNFPATAKFHQLSFRHEACVQCGVRLLTCEDPKWCHDPKKKLLDPLPPYPDEFRDVVQTLGIRTVNSHIRKLNNLFSFAAIGIESGRFVQMDVPSNLAITGRTYHQVRNLRVGSHSLGWFIYDENGFAAESGKLNLPPRLTRSTQDMLSSQNPFIRTLQSAYAATRLQYPPNTDFTVELQYGAVQGSREIAAVVRTANIQNLNPRSVWVTSSSSGQHNKMSILSNHYEPMAYPLFFPCGTPGWGSRTFADHDRRWLTQIDVYKQRLLREIRFREFGLLTNEYLIDMYSRVEEERLIYLKRGRADQLYKHRQQLETDPLGNADALIAFDDSMRIPFNFPGSRAWSSNMVADALALCREFGKPSLFITFTTNPNWPEFKNNLLPGQSLCDDPVLVCRIFNARLKQLKAYIRRQFGKIKYMISVVEFQKRGLPHAHMVIKVKIILHG